MTLTKQSSLVLIVVLALPGRGMASEDRTLSPYFFVKGGDPSVDQLPLEKTRVQVNISGVVADLTVRQTYKNEGSRPISARYVFPASTRAAVHGMKMIIGDSIIEAKIKEREKARKTYERARKAGKSASLLEQQRPNVFTMNVANIMPGDKIQVELRYTELLVPTDGVYELVYPTVVGPRYSSQPESTAPRSERWIKSPYTHSGKPPTYFLNLSGTIATGVPITGLSCPSHKIQTRWEGPAIAHFLLDDAERQGGNRDFVLRYRLTGNKIASGLLLYKGVQENHFLLMVQPPKHVPIDQIPPREVVFILDVSGSMHGFPLNTAKKAMRDLIGGLRSTDRFNVLFFSGGSSLLSPSSLPATKENVTRAIQMIDGQSGGGGTALLSAVKHAMTLPLEGAWSRSFVVVTDGYISAEREVFTYIRSHLGQANVFSFGIGSSVNRHLVEGIAKAGKGEPFVILGPDQVPRITRRFNTYVRTPVLTNITVKFSGFQAYDIEPPAIGDLFAQRPVVVHGKWRGHPHGTITLTGVSGSGPYRYKVDLSSVQPSPMNRPLVHLWARQRIAALSDFAFDRETEQERETITALGLRYNLLTRHTSFVAVHHKVRNTEAPARQVQQPLPLPQGVSNRAVGVTSGDEPELVVLLALLLALMIVVAASWSRQGKAWR